MKFSYLLLFSAFLSGSVWAMASSKKTEQVFCTTDVKECPDGSFVNRDPKANCKFKPCPNESKSSQQGPGIKIPSCSDHADSSSCEKKTK